MMAASHSSFSSRFWVSRNERLFFVDERMFRMINRAVGFQFSRKAKGYWIVCLETEDFYDSKRLF